MRRLLKALVLIGTIAVPVETMSYIAGRILAEKALVYYPPRAEDYAGYLSYRDPVLGWPNQASFGQGEFDRSGSRLVPAFPDPAQPSCAALFGDSFTWGDEATAEQAYGNVLAGLMGCRVANYGVGGYGTDQAYLRYERVIRDNAPIVILGHYSQDIIRNVNQDRGFISNEALGLKPRFRLEGTELVLVPLPTLTETEYLRLGSHAQELLPYDYFAPGGASGIRSLEFPFTLSVLGTIRHYQLIARLKGQPSYAQFYDPAHPSQALQITEAIVKRFASEARRRGQKPMLLLIPDVKDLRSLRTHGSLPYAELGRRVRNAGVTVLDAAVELNKSLGNRDPCALYTRCANGHLNADGYRRLAEIIFSKLTEMGWIRAHEPRAFGAPPERGPGVLYGVT